MVHVLDASRSVVVCSSLLDEAGRADYLADISEEYEEVREDHYENLREKCYLPLQRARSLRPNVDWSAAARSIVRPTFLGTRTFMDYSLETLLPYIGRNGSLEGSFREMSIIIIFNFFFF